MQWHLMTLFGVIPVYKNLQKLQKYKSGGVSGVIRAEFVQFGDLSVSTFW